MITLREAQDLIDGKVKSLHPEDKPIGEAVGCAVASDISSPINVPGFANSKMDGIALRFDDLNGNGGPWRLPLQAIIAAGDKADQELRPGYAVKIMTGAPMAEGADTVVKVEDVSFEGNTVVIKDNVSAGQFVRSAGDDIEAGGLLFKAGHVLTPVDTGVLASIGLSKIKVIPRPRISMLSTGSELVEPGKPLLPGQIYNSNSSTLQALLLQNGLEAEEITSMVPDEKATLNQVVRRCMLNSDLIITSGGVSMGDYDYLPDVVRQLGGEVLFHKARVKPGKPVLVASLGQSWILGLPGNPVSVVASYHLYVRRAIARIMGQEFNPRKGKAVLKGDVKVHGDRFCLVGACLKDESDGVAAYPATRQDSGRLSSIRGLNGFIMMDESTRSLSAGDTADVEWLY